MNRSPRDYGYRWDYPVPLLFNWRFWKKPLAMVLFALITLNFLVAAWALLTRNSGIIFWFFLCSLLLSSLLLLYTFFCVLVRQVMWGGQTGKFYVDRGGAGHELGPVFLLDSPTLPFFGGNSTVNWKAVSQVTVDAAAGVIEFKRSWVWPQVTVYCEPGMLQELVSFIETRIDPPKVVYA